MGDEKRRREGWNKAHFFCIARAAFGENIDCLGLAVFPRLRVKK